MCMRWLFGVVSCYICLCCSFALHCSTVKAGVAGTSIYSWTQQSDNGRYTFVGKSSLSVEQQLELLSKDDVLGATEKDQLELLIRNIDSNYDGSGMYLNEDPPILIWRAQGWGGKYWEDNGLISASGNYLVCRRERLLGNPGTSSLFAIYDQGGRIRQISIEDLFSTPEWLVRSLCSPWKTEYYIALDNEVDDLTVTNTEGDEFRICIENGEIVSTTSTFNTILIAASHTNGRLLMLGLLFLFVVGSWLVTTFCKLWLIRVFSRRVPQTQDS